MQYAHKYSEYSHWADPIYFVFVHMTINVYGWAQQRCLPSGLVNQYGAAFITRSQAGPRACPLTRSHRTPAGVPLTAAGPSCCRGSGPRRRSCSAPWSCRSWACSRSPSCPCRQPIRGEYCVLLSTNQSSPARQPGLAVHGDHEAGPLEPLLARSVEIVTVLLGLKSHHNLQTHCRR